MSTRKVEELKETPPVGDTLDVYDNAWEQVKDMIMAVIKSDRHMILKVKALNLLSDEGRKKIGKLGLPLREIASALSSKSFFKEEMRLSPSHLVDIIPTAVKEDIEENPSEFVLNKSDLRLASQSGSDTLTAIAHAIRKNPDNVRRLSEVRKKREEADEDRNKRLETISDILKGFIKPKLISSASEVFEVLFRKLPVPKSTYTNYEPELKKIYEKVEDSIEDYLESLRETGNGTRGTNPSMAVMLFNRLLDKKRLKVPSDIKEKWLEKLKTLVRVKKAELAGVQKRLEYKEDYSYTKVFNQLNRDLPSVLRDILEVAAETDESITLPSLKKEIKEALVEGYRGTQETRYVGGVASDVLDKNGVVIQRALNDYLTTDAFESGDTPDYEEMSALDREYQQYDFGDESESDKRSSFSFQTQDTPSYVTDTGTSEKVKSLASLFLATKPPRKRDDEDFRADIELVLEEMEKGYENTQEWSEWVGGEVLREIEDFYIKNKDKFDEGGRRKTASYKRKLMAFRQRRNR